MINPHTPIDPHAPGRRPVYRDPQFYLQVLSYYDTMSLRDIAKIYNVSQTTIHKWVRMGRTIRESDQIGQ